MILEINFYPPLNFHQWHVWARFERKRKAKTKCFGLICRFLISLWLVRFNFCRRCINPSIVWVNFEIKRSSVGFFYRFFCFCKLFISF
jgi:hypothetical protein